MEYSKNDLKENIRRIFSTNLKKLRKEKNITQVELAKILEISKQAINNYENEKSLPGDKTLEKISNFFNIEITSLLPIQELHEIENLYDTTTPPTHFISTLVDNYTPIRIEENLSAGLPDEVILTDEICYIPKKYEQKIKKKLVRAFRVNGESMNNIIQHGDIAIIEKSENVVKNGDILAVQIEDGYDITLKRFYRYEDKIVLRPDTKNTDDFFDIVLPVDANIFVLGKLVYYVLNEDVRFN